MKIGVVGASGYSGGELLRLLLGHPEFEISYIAAGSNAGEFITALHPHLIPFGERRFEKTEVSEINKCQLVFLALPPGESAKLVTAISPSTMIVDLGADFRLHDSSAWEKYYGGVHAGTRVSNSGSQSDVASITFDFRHSITPGAGMNTTVIFFPSGSIMQSKVSP